MVAKQQEAHLEAATIRKFAATKEDIMVEQALVNKAKQGDNFAIGSLYDAHSAAVRRLLVSVLGSGDYIDDLSQDVFIQVFASIASFKGECRFATWLHRIALNTAISFLRKKKRMPAFADDSLFPATMATQDRHAHLRQELQALYAILDTLSPKRRIAFILFEIEEYSIAEIASMTGSNVAAVKSRLFFGRQEILKKAAANKVLRDLMDNATEGTPQ